MNEFENIVKECSMNVNELINLFVRCRVQYWDEKYVKIADALNELDLDLALNLENKIAKTGIGELNDLIISKGNGHNSQNYNEDNAQLQTLI